jgi:hypothetical protein
MTIDGAWISNQIYGTRKQLMTTLNKSLSHIDECSPSYSSLCHLIMAFSGVMSLASVSNGSCPYWLAPTSCSS